MGGAEDTGASAEPECLDLPAPSRRIPVIMVTHLRPLLHAIGGAGAADLELA